MSLINEALKKAQRQRNEDAASAAPMPGGGRVAKRGQATGVNSIVLIGAGALVLVLLSVGVTVYLLNRPAPPAPVAVARVEPVAKSEPSASSPAISLPAMPPPSAAQASSPIATPTSNPITAAPEPVLPRAPESRQPPPPVETRADSAPPPSQLAAGPSPAETAKPDEGIYQYVDALRITGVKAAGSDSRVLMNDRVYRVNDIVERNLGVRLIKVESNTLTFSDAQGAVYVKNF